MNKVLYIILISLFSLTVFSCTKSDDSKTATTDNTTSSSDDSSDNSSSSSVPRGFVAVGNEGTIVKSTDNGSSFDNVTSPGGWDLGGVVFGNTTLVAVGQAGVVFSSTDNGSTWNKWMDWVNSSHFNGVTFGNDIFVAVADDGIIIRSTNGSTWNNVTSLTA
ncbi:MAG: hypothetical protein QGF64_07915, partial [Candidatus Poseidoniia archaeon]|nr:hypothetical protein [Candidatus Poseidoniia archaeon]